eukprot:1036571-Rhodomonas_salina.3
MCGLGNDGGSAGRWQAVDVLGACERCLAFYMRQVTQLLPPNVSACPCWYCHEGLWRYQHAGTDVGVCCYQDAGTDVGAWYYQEAGLLYTMQAGEANSATCLCEVEVVPAYAKSATCLCEVRYLPAHRPYRILGTEPACRTARSANRPSVRGAILYRPVFRISLTVDR